MSVAQRPHQEPGSEATPPAGEHLQRLRIEGAHLLYDPARCDAPIPQWFDPGWWDGRAALIGRASGRGTTYFVQAADDVWALRQCLRGGLVAKINHDRYLWTGLRRARPFAEMRLLSALVERGLPVPAPIAALVRPGIGHYRGAVITRRIEQAAALPDRLTHRALAAEAWQRLGALLARFHAAGVEHADLNARNVLVDASERFHLVDFDKARLRGTATGRWRQANLDRLKASLDKFRGADLGFHFLDADWAALRGGYLSAAAGRR